MFEPCYFIFCFPVISLPRRPPIRTDETLFPTRILNFDPAETIRNKHIGYRDRKGKPKWRKWMSGYEQNATEIPLPWHANVHHIATPTA